MKDRTPESQVIIFDLDDTLYKEVDFVMSAYHHIDRLLVAEHDTKPGKAFRILRDSFKAGGLTLRAGKKNFRRVILK